MTSTRRCERKCNDAVGQSINETHNLEVCPNGSAREQERTILHRIWMTMTMMINNLMISARNVSMVRNADISENTT
eukprot:scaffold2927_cov268-Chaetoceros_neogracile.AAC.53